MNELLAKAPQRGAAKTRRIPIHVDGAAALGQYLQPRPGNLAVERCVAPAQFDAPAGQAQAMGFSHAACGPLVRSSCHADRQAHAAGI
ncbi:Lipoyl synthase [Variovorax sp. SRS16]|uniref:hypothetical protein n=1 Tax=Variovorax sp. SRS16 TaxID=282217 RepID=UPI0013192BFE|nr:Lipoyl synthase [Variovorax sp. SRS16]